MKRSDGMLENAILIAGPTVQRQVRGWRSNLVRRSSGTIINADSMQVYSILRLLTARPSQAEMDAVAHVLYGHVDPREAYSTGRGLGEVEALAAGGALDAGPAILRRRQRGGGPPLYFQGAAGGAFAHAQHSGGDPRDLAGKARGGRVPERCMRSWRGATPVAADTLQPNDGQRIVRALRNLRCVGPFHPRLAGIGGAEPLVNANSARLMVLEPDRAEVVARIERGFDAMVEQGAMEEVRALVGLDLPPLHAGDEGHWRARTGDRDGGHGDAAGSPFGEARRRRANMPSASRHGVATQLGANGEGLQPEEATDLSFCY